MNLRTAGMATMTVMMLTLPLGASAQEPADLRECLDNIQRRGMSEMATSHITGIAGIRLGQSTLTFAQYDQAGRYWPSYQSNTCPVPGTHPDTLAVRQRELTVAREAEMAILQPLADSDGSGFVSTKEAGTFRTVFEFGVLMTQLSQEADFSREKALLATGLDDETFDQRLAAYDEVRRKATTANVPGFPELVAP